MKTKLLRILASVAALLVICGCTGTAGDDIPFGITVYHVYLFDKDKAPNADHFAGSVETTYLKRKDDLDRARRLAYAEATRLKFDTNNSRYYIVCTGTKNSRCVTKIR